MKTESPIDQLLLKLEMACAALEYWQEHPYNEQNAKVFNLMAARVLAHSPRTLFAIYEAELRQHILLQAQETIEDEGSIAPLLNEVATRLDRLYCDCHTSDLTMDAPRIHRPAHLLSEMDIEMLQQEILVVRRELGYPDIDDVKPLDVLTALRTLKATTCHMIDERNKCVDLLNVARRQLMNDHPHGKPAPVSFNPTPALIPSQQIIDLLNKLPDDHLMSKSEVEWLLLRRDDPHSQPMSAHDLMVEA